MTERLLTIPQVAQAMSVSPSFVWRRVLSGRWPSHKLGRTRRISEADIRRLLDAAHREGTACSQKNESGAV
jgi:excisionase family DNA binding protein